MNIQFWIIPVMAHLALFVSAVVYLTRGIILGDLISVLVGATLMLIYLVSNLILGMLGN